VRLALGLLPFGRARACVERCTRRTVLHGASLHDITWAVNAVARRLPFTRCLPRALALQALLRQAGIASELRIGVRKEPDGLLAHAWIEHQGRILADGVDPTAYAPLPSLH
jgi:hypothetical protein